MDIVTTPSLLLDISNIHYFIYTYKKNNITSAAIYQSTLKSNAFNHSS